MSSSSSSSNSSSSSSQVCSSADNNWVVAMAMQKRPPSQGHYLVMFAQCERVSLQPELELNGWVLLTVSVVLVVHSSHLS